MLAIAEQCKLELSRRPSTDFIFERVVGGNEDIDLTITRQDFERLIADALDSACNRIDDALRQAGIQDIDIYKVLLTGGTCYIPAVKARMIEKFGQRVAEVQNADLAIAQGAAVIAEMGWLPFLTKDIHIALSGGSFWPIFEHDMPIAAQKPAHNSEEFNCVDCRMKRAKVIVCEGLGQTRDKNLAVLNIPVLGNPKFGDEIVVEAELDRNIVLTVKGHSKMAICQGAAIRKTAEITQLCFGLDFRGVKHGY
jgi:molecular chaperone DnaK (HSP70)